MNDGKQSTPAGELERQICSATEPKNEREWWAHHEIARLLEISRLRAELLEASKAALTAERAKVERLRKAMEEAAHKLETARIWGGMKYEWVPAHPVIVVQPTHAKLRAALEDER